MSYLSLDIQVYRFQDREIFVATDYALNLRGLFATFGGSVFYRENLPLDLSLEEVRVLVNRLLTQGELWKRCTSTQKNGKLEIG